MKPRGADDRSRLAAIRAGDPAAVARFLSEISGMVWSACRILCSEENEARIAFTETMAALMANRFARLAAYSGRSTLHTFVTLVVRELVAERVLRLLQEDRERGWRAFEQLFTADIARLIRRRIPGASHEELRRDAYQEVCLALIESDYRRLKSYNGSGSFAGFVLRMADRLVIDHLRSFVSRRRLPATVARLAPLDQQIFKLLVWERLPRRAEILQAPLAAQLGRTPESAEIDAAFLRLSEHMPTNKEGLRLVRTEDDPAQMPDETEPTPEERLLAQEKEKQLCDALAALERAMVDTPADERLYLTIALGGGEPRPAREIARLMRRPVEDIYKLKQRVITRLREAVARDPAVKIWRASV
jgi:RNA polymerase primary sigma factor